tara:strand:- start:457 stop:1557 length:1101 start_codon:yes stop_codon:yes gene_type:complete
MLDALKSLFENNAISEEIRAEISQAWDKRIKENRLEATAELREEFAQKYEHDKATMVEAIDKMLEERLGAEITEFSEDRNKLAEARAKYAVAMRENAELLKTFVVGQLGKEIGELHEDQKAMASKFSKLEDFVVDSLSKEIAEFYEDKKDLAETKVRLVREAKEHLAKVKGKFIKDATRIVAETVEKGLSNEISQLKEDIESARKNDFGRKIFESFASEYSNSYLNEKSETAKLLKIVDLKDKQLAEAKVIAVEKAKLVESKDAEIKAAENTAKRNKIMNELVAPLNKKQQEIMNDLLESVQTDKLQKQFDKYMPSVIAGNSPAKETKATLTEGTQVTGNKQNNDIDAGSSNTDNVIDIRRLAGIN